MSTDTEQVVRLLEHAATAALAGGMVGVEINLTDEDGVVWVYRWVPAPGAVVPRVVGPIARMVQ
jgi:hypothetical protein